MQNKGIQSKEDLIIVKVFFIWGNSHILIFRKNKNYSQIKQVELLKNNVIMILLIKSIQELYK